MIPTIVIKNILYYCFQSFDFDLTLPLAFFLVRRGHANANARELHQRKVAGLDKEVSLSHTHHTVVVWDCTTRARTYPASRQAADFAQVHAEGACVVTRADRPIRAPLLLLPRAFLCGCQIAVQSLQPLLRSRGDTRD